MKAAIYARVSSDRQREQATIESQLTSLPDFARARGWEVVGTYVDDGKTASAGHLERRDGLGQLMADAGAGRFEVVCVVDLDRLTRSEDLQERGLILGTLQRAGVRVAVSGTGQVLDLRDSTGDLLAALGGFFSADWLRKHRERVKRGKDRAIAAGRKPSGPTPYGLRYSRATGAWSIDETEAAIVREAFARVAMGESCETIAIDFELRGVKRKRSTKWHRERVLVLVKSPTYRGVWTVDKARRLTVAVPPIVEPELWYAADAALQAYGRRGLRQAKHSYLLEARAVCALCGAKMGINWGGSMKPGRRRPYYICGRRRRVRYGEDRCLLPMRPTAEVDEALWAAVVQLLATPRWLEDALAARRHQRGDRQRDFEGELAEMENKVSRLQTVERALLERFRRGLVSEEAMDGELERITRERRDLERHADKVRREVAQANLEHGGAEAMIANIALLRARLEDADDETRRELVGILLPGGGEHIARIGAETLEATVVLSAGSEIVQAQHSGYSSTSSYDLAVPLRVALG